jgi:hypothetical protein
MLFGSSFREILREKKMNFVEFMRSKPSVCRVLWVGGEALIERVTSEALEHIEKLKQGERTKRKKKPIKFFSQRLAKLTPLFIASDRNYFNRFRPSIPSTFNRSYPSAAGPLKRTNSIGQPRPSFHPPNFKPILAGSTPGTYSQRPKISSIVTKPIKPQPPTILRTNHKPAVRHNPTWLNRKPSQGSQKLPPLPHELGTTVIYKGVSDDDDDKENVATKALPLKKEVVPSNEVITIESSDEENACIEISSDSSDSEKVIPESDSDDGKVNYYSVDYNPLPKLTKSKQNKVDWEKRYLELQQILHPKVQGQMFLLPKINLINRRSPEKTFNSSPSSSEEEFKTIENDFIIAPFNIPKTSFKELPCRELKQVQLMEVFSPSSFTLRYSITEYEQMSKFLK